MNRSLLLSAVAAVGLMITQANAAVQLTMSANVDAAYDNTTDFDPVAYTLSPTATKGVVYEIPIYFEMDDVPAGWSFSNLAFDVTWDGSATPDLNANGTGQGAYVGSTATYVSGKNPTPYYSGNADTGTSTTDLQDIVAYFPVGTATSQRASAGIGSPFLLGYVYFDLPTTATTTSHIYITPITTPANQFSENQDGTSVQDTSATLSGAEVTLIVPEPASLGMLSMGALGLLARRRRQV